jgi:ribose 5-phosphate isomerase B
MKTTLLIGSDHAGFVRKQELKSRFPNIDWKDFGTNSEDSVDYPDFADKVAKEIQKNGGRGVLICGSGQGMAIRANRYSKIRAALCWNTEIAKLSREHNNANILCMGARFVDTALAESILKVFLETEFAGGRHEGRVNKLSVEC